MGKLQERFNYLMQTPRKHSTKKLQENILEKESAGNVHVPALGNKMEVRTATRTKTTIIIFL